jgi:hypothetical protein
MPNDRMLARLSPSVCPTRVGVHPLRRHQFGETVPKCPKSRHRLHKRSIASACPAVVFPSSGAVGPFVANSVARLSCDIAKTTSGAIANTANLLHRVRRY